MPRTSHLKWVLWVSSPPFSRQLTILCSLHPIVSSYSQLMILLGVECLPPPTTKLTNLPEFHLCCYLKPRPLPALLIQVEQYLSLSLNHNPFSLLGLFGIISISIYTHDNTFLRHIKHTFFCEPSLSYHYGSLYSDKCHLIRDVFPV